ncbi:MAG: thioredoxin [Candidatus Latescibacteria bacterium]|nr:thioredoxin [Candidatus Latescibacterota bacterium]
MGTLTEVSDQTFQAEVINSDKPVVVDFWAPWCMPCRMLTPVLEKVAGKTNGSVKFLKMDVDKNHSTAAQYGVMSIPSVAFFKGGQEIKRLIGVQTEKVIKAELDKLI